MARMGPVGVAISIAASVIVMGTNSPYYATVTVFHEGPVKGFLHAPDVTAGDRGLVLTHGAGGNCQAPLLVTIADAFCSAGFIVLRCDMAFRQHKPFGPPSPATSGADRASLRAAVEAMRKMIGGTVILGGHSYGGRQSTMLAAEDPSVAEALLLLSYPLHPPGKPAQPLTAHFPALRTPALFVHGTKDPFGTTEELTEALKMIPTRTELITVPGAGHDVNRGKFNLSNTVMETLRALVAP
jgi:predicted alpha/beta-hydrolase family hydrolase